MKTYIVGMLVFSFFFSIGIVLARHKPLWNDELWGQQVTVQQSSWPNIISGHPKEWNSFPLYHALQKGLMQLMHWQLPFVWERTWFVVHPQAQIVLRILPDFLTSIALSAIVLFFGLRSGFVSALVALLICLSMPMVWLYWVEARSYSLWFTLTVLQSLLFLDTASKKGSNRPAISFLLVQLGLCLTAPLGIVQTIVCQGLLWCVGNRRIKFHVIAALAPLFLGTYYLMAQERMKMCLAVSWQDTFFYNFTMEELIFLSMYVLFMILSLGRSSLRKYLLWGRIFLPFCLIYIVITIAGIFYVICKSIPEAAPVVPRHFIFLTPIGMIMTAAIFSDLWLATSKHLGLRSAVLIVFAAGLLSQFLSVFVLVNKLGIYF